MRNWNNTKSTVLFVMIYGFLRIFSFYFEPGSIVNSITTSLFLLLTFYFLLKRSVWGWYIVAAEIILSGSGNFLSLFSISLRSWLLIFSLSSYCFHVMRDKGYTIFNKSKSITYLLSFIFLSLLIATLRGLAFHHSPHEIIADVIPYLFFLYYFPLKELLASKSLNLQIFQSLIIAAILGNTLFTLFTLAGFSAGHFALQDSYYHWFRDVANGKITDLGLQFYRVVLNEQLLLIPLFLFFLYRIIYKEETRKFGNYEISHESQKFLYFPVRTGPRLGGGVISLFLVILSLNLTRVYLLALAIGYLFLFTKQHWKRWLTVGFVSCFLFLVSFTTIHLLASRGQSLGWEIFGLRLQSIVSPNLEESSLSRLLLLPKIMAQIQQHPILGRGFGDTVTAYSPVYQQTITTGQFDWGYLEIWDEMGLIGLLAWLLLIGYLIINFRKNDAPKWQLASLVSLLVINITSPALFHVLGVVWTTYLITNTTIADNQFS